MLNIFLGTLRALGREKVLFIWTLAFPLVLSTLFMVMFSGLDTASDFKALPTAVVADKNYDAAPAFAKTMDALSAPGENQMLELREIETQEEADQLLKRGEVTGYISVDTAGEPQLFVQAGARQDSFFAANQTVLKTIVDGYVRNAALIADIAQTNPAALADPAALESLFSLPNATQKVSLTHNAPQESVRYYYALLGMATLFAGQIGLVAICRTQPNLSALGARRAMAATSRTKTLTATLAASWLLSFICLLVAFLYIRFVVGIDFGGREAVCVLALATASLFATAFGTLLGALPKISEGGKCGMLTGISCFAALFTGLYGSPAMAFADTIARIAPFMQLINPATQIANVFYSLYYYDTFVRTGEALLVLLVMTLVLFAISLLFIRRQRYASI